ncbi:MAG: complex I NDUFA9 subunit family protein [Xanthomonadales bacterium]|jgi:NADH dehydrogenase|nr:complex I NDUFA9 subunit family protein [Xanthomonadales bacterium]
MRIVLLGSTGFLGHYVLPALARDGHRCIALTRYRPGCRELALLPGVSVVQNREFSAEALARHLEGADAAVNMVGILNEPGRSGKGFRKAHVDLTNTLLEACRKTGVRRIVQVGALGAGQGSSHYLVSKGEAEALLMSASDIDATVIRPSVIFGRGDSFFNRFAGLLKLAPVLPLACPDARMQPVWAGDVAALLARVIGDPASYGRSLDAVGPRVYSLKRLVEFAAHTAGLKRKVVGLPNALARLQAAVMDFVPGKPFSSDNYRSLQTANTSNDNALPEFGIQPASIEAVVPGYLAQGKHQRRLDACRRHVDT